MPDRRRTAMTLLMAASVFALPAGLLAQNQDGGPSASKIQNKTERELQLERLMAARPAERKIVFSGSNRLSLFSKRQPFFESASARGYTEGQLRDARVVQFQAARGADAGGGVNPSTGSVVSHPTLGRVVINRKVLAPSDPKAANPRIILPDQFLIYGPSSIANPSASKPKDFGTASDPGDSGKPGSGGDSGSGPKLYLGIAGHWVDTEANPNVAWSEVYDFGPTAMNYRWLTQGEVRIRAARLYGDPERGRQYAWANVNPRTSTYELMYDRRSGRDALNAWVADAKSAFEIVMDDDPLKDTGGRMIQLDNETLHFLGWYWGRFMQAQGDGPIAQYTNIEDIHAHSAAFIPWGVAFMSELQAAYPNDKFAWYNLPVARDSRNVVLHEDPTHRDHNKHHPWTGDAYDRFEFPSAPVGTFPWWYVDEGLRPLLDQADYVDGRLYAGRLNAEQRRPYWNGQMERGLAIAADLAEPKPYMTKIWLGNVYSPTTLQDPAFIRDFFAEAAANFVEHVSADEGRTPFECACELAGQAPDVLWNDLIVRAAYEAGYGGAPVTDQLRLVSTTPDSGKPHRTIEVRLHGSGFGDGMDVSVSGAGVSVSRVTALSETDIRATLDISPSASIGPRDITVTQGSESWTLPGAFEVFSLSKGAPAPRGFMNSGNERRPASVSSCVGPSRLEQGARNITVRLAGRHFQNGCTVTAIPPKGGGSGVTLGDTTTLLDSNRIEFPVSVSGTAMKGDWTIRVTNPDSQSAQDWKLMIY